MKKRWLLLLVLVLNHTLITSALAAVHSSTEYHNAYEPAHIHIVDEKAPDTPDTEGTTGHDHEGSAHVHVPCDHGALPLIISPPQTPLSLIQAANPPPQYLGQAYKPLLPPPNA